MTGLSISPRDRRTLLLGGVVIAGLVTGFRGLPAWREWRMEQRTGAAAAMARATRIESTVAGFSVSLDTLGARTARLLKAGSGFLVCDTLPQAAAMLAGILAEAARASMVRIEAVETRTLESDSTALPRVVLELKATGDIAGLAALLRQLEGGPTVVAIRRLSVRPQNPESPSTQAEVLSFGLTVEALALVLNRGEP